MKTLILYFTTDGQTQKIAEVIATELEHDVELVSIRDQAVDFAEKIANSDQIVIGASIRYGHFNKKVYQLIEQHYGALNQKPSAFFSVNLTARKENRKTPETNIYTRKFLERVQWTPNLVEVIAGALFYPRYTLLDRLCIQLIMKITKGDTDASQEYEYTDWQQVRHFGQRLNKVSEGKFGKKD